MTGIKRQDACEVRAAACFLYGFLNAINTIGMACICQEVRRPLTAFIRRWTGMAFQGKVVGMSTDSVRE